MSYDRHVVELAQPFPDMYVHRNPSGGGSYIKHHVINQRLIQVLGTPPDFELVQVLRGDVAGAEPDPEGKSKRAREGRPALTNVVVGVVARMTVRLGSVTRVEEEAGDCEDPHNWAHDGGRLKDAMSDAYKRCAMRLGCGLHLWSQDEYFLYDQLLKAQPEKEVTSPGEGTPSHSPTDIGASAPPDSSAGESQRATEAGHRAEAKTSGGEPTAHMQSSSPAASPQEDPEQGEPGAGSSSWEQQIEAYSKRHRWGGEVAAKVGVIAMEKRVRAPGNWKQVLETPEIHEDVARELGLTQEAML